MRVNPWAMSGALRYVTARVVELQPCTAATGASLIRISRALCVGRPRSGDSRRKQRCLGRTSLSLSRQRREVYQPRASPWEMSGMIRAPCRGAGRMGVYPPHHRDYPRPDRAGMDGMCRYPGRVCPAPLGHRCTRHSPTHTARTSMPLVRVYRHVRQQIMRVAGSGADHCFFLHRIVLY